MQLPKPPQEVQFHSWVPTWLKLVVALFILIPTMMTNGVYNGISIDISNFFGALSEDINFALFASSAGMAMAYPMSRKIKLIATPKTIILSSFIFQIFFSLICLHAKYIGIIVVFSFLIGFLKAFTLREVMAILLPMIEGGSGKRSRFYSVYYPITLGIAQISMLLTAKLAYDYQWQYTYYFMIALMLGAIIVVLICLRYARRPLRIPFKEIEWVDMFLICIFFMSFIYFLTYGKYNDWFASKYTWVALIASVFSLTLFIRRQLSTKDPYIDFSVLCTRNTLVGYVLVFCLLLFAQTNTLVSSYTTKILKLDSIHSNLLYLWTIPGILIGAPICYWWYEKKYSIRIIILMGFLCLILSNVMIYFQVSTQGTYESLYPSMLIKGIGLMMMYVVFGVYVLEPLPHNKRLSNAFFIIGIRSVLIPVVGSALFSNWLYQLQTKNTMLLSTQLNMENPLFAEQYNRTLHSAFMQGFGVQEAQMLALNNITNNVQIQSLLVSIKEVLGYTILGSIPFIIFILLFTFYKEEKMTDTQVGTDMV